jgi:hypothetical protein
MRRCCINSKGELIVLFWSEDNLAFILKRSGELKSFCDLQPAKTNLRNRERRIVSLAVDRNDNLYVMVRFSSQSCTKDVETYVLFVFEPNGNKKRENVLDFTEDESHYATIVVNNDGEVIIHFCRKDYLYVCDSNGNLKSRLSLGHHSTF